MSRRARNRRGKPAGYTLNPPETPLRWLVKPIIDEINTYRAEHRLRLLEGDNLGEGSAMAHIAQQSAFFDYPREALPFWRIPGCKCWRYYHPSQSEHVF
jgi:hypothetical protein